MESMNFRGNIKFSKKENSKCYITKFCIIFAFHSIEKGHFRFDPTEKERRLFVFMGWHQQIRFWPMDKDQNVTPAVQRAFFSSKPTDFLSFVWIYM